MERNDSCLGEEGREVGATGFRKREKGEKEVGSILALYTSLC